MRKSTVFISAVLTTFALVMLYSVASAYRGSKKAAEAAAQPTFTPAPEPTELPAPAAFVLTPEEAAQLAVQVIGNSNLLSAESSSINGMDAYKITFTNNDVVYVGLDGQVLAVEVAPVVVNVPPPAKPKRDNPGGGGNVSSGAAANGAGGEGNHEDHDD